jgi:hypothetical protein
MHLTQTDLYVAVENWLTVCAVLFTLCTYLLVTIATGKAAVKRAAVSVDK